jgi:hypothetical protein
LWTKDEDTRIQSNKLRLRLDDGLGMFRPENRDTGMWLLAEFSRENARIFCVLALLDSYGLALEAAATFSAG